MAVLNPWAASPTSSAGLPTGHTDAVHRTAGRWAPRIAMGFAVAALVAFPLSVWLYVANRAHVPGTQFLFGDYTAGLLYPLVGAYLLRRRPDNRVGWVFAATSVIGLNGLAGQYAIAATYLHPHWPLRDLAAWFNAWAWAP